jgi:hypothetical protein
MNIVLLRRRTYSGTDIVGSCVRLEVFGLEVRLCVRDLVPVKFEMMPASQLLKAPENQRVYITCHPYDGVIAQEVGGAYHRSCRYKLFQHRPPPHMRSICTGVV